MRDTVVSDNGLDGILVRDGARLNAEGVRVTHNMGHGFNLCSGFGTFTDCLSSTNGKGAILLDNAFEADTAQTGISMQ